MSPPGADDDPSAGGSDPADESPSDDDIHPSESPPGDGSPTDRASPEESDRGDTESGARRDDGGPPRGEVDEGVADETPFGDASARERERDGSSPVETGPGPDGVSGATGTGRRERAGSETARTATESTDQRGMDWRTFAYDVGSSAGAVLVVGLLLFAVSGVWPPMVAVESPSMYPNMQTGDLVFVMDEERFPGEGARAGVVTARVGTETGVDYRKFQRQGDVIVFKPDGDSDRTPIIHRAMFWVNESENWYEKADRQSIGRYDECGDNASEALPNCPAPHAGFVTKGDNNGVYDQSQGLSGPVKPAWVVGTAELRIPKLGCIRLRSERCANGLIGTVAPGASATTVRGEVTGTAPEPAAATLEAANNATVAP